MCLDVLGASHDISGADRFVGFLGVLGLRFIRARATRYIVAAVFPTDQGPAPADGFIGNKDAVGPHIGDQADRFAAERNAFVEALRHLHGALGGHAQLAGRFLLQGRGGKRCRRVPPGLFLLDRADGKIAAEGGIDGGGGGGLIA